jgi:hypothetical protein
MTAALTGERISNPQKMSRSELQITELQDFELGQEQHSLPSPVTV